MKKIIYWKVLYYFLPNRELVSRSNSLSYMYTNQLLIYTENNNVILFNSVIKIWVASQYNAYNFSLIFAIRLNKPNR